MKAILTPRARFPYCKLFGWGRGGGETPRARFPYCKLFGCGAGAPPQFFGGGAEWTPRDPA